MIISVGMKPKKAVTKNSTARSGAKRDPVWWKGETGAFGKLHFRASG